VAKANATYSALMLPLLLKHGNLPVFGSDVMGTFLEAQGGEEWDYVAMVRYRSRRDMLQMAVEISGNNADIHKWAAIEKTQVFPVKPALNLIFIRFFIAVLLAGGAWLVLGLLSVLTKRSIP